MKRFLVTAGAAATLVAGTALAAPSAFAAGPLPNGFTAKVIAHSGQTINWSVNATGYDVGIYIGPGVHGVKVLGARVSGANDEGILVQDTRDVLIKNSTVTGNTQHPAANLEELKGIVLTGTHNVVVSFNRVTDNGDGGIGVYDDGPNSSSTNAPVAIDSHGVTSYNNVVYGNTVADNLNGCGIVVAGKNPGGGVLDNIVAYNTVKGFDPAAGDTTPGVGGIVLAGGEFGAVRVAHTTVLHNTVTGGFIPGISLHASSPAVLYQNYLLENTLTRNGGNPESHGIEIATSTGTIQGTQVIHDHVVGDQVGVFHVGDTNTRILGLTTSNVPTPVAP